MSGFRDSLKGRYYGELGSGFVLIVRGRGGGREESWTSGGGAAVQKRRGKGEECVAGGELEFRTLRMERWGEYGTSRQWSH